MFLFWHHTYQKENNYATELCNFINYYILFGIKVHILTVKGPSLLYIDTLRFFDGLTVATVDVHVDSPTFAEHAAHPQTLT